MAKHNDERAANTEDDESNDGEEKTEVRVQTSLCLHLYCISVVLYIVV